MRPLSRLLLAVLLLLAPLSTGLLEAQEKSDKKIRVILIDGQNNHDWRTTSQIMKKALEGSGRFTIDVSSNLRAKDKPGNIEKTIPFPPKLEEYDVLVSNYNGDSWPKEFNASLEERLKDGKIGLVIVHAANNAFGGWDEYNKMIGMGWRGKNAGSRLKLDSDGNQIVVPKGDDLDSGHRSGGKFPIIVRNPDHPITKGMPKEWMHDNDELYDNMRGPIENVSLLATAYSNGTKAHEPMIWTVSYGKGRVFHTPMGHGADSMRCAGYQTTLNRGTEWAATGAVTLPIPANFPTAEKTSSNKD